MSQPDPAPGVRAHVTRGPWGQPEQIRHAKLGLRWEVLEVIETWQRPDDSPAGEGQPVLMSREVLLVYGPRPGRPGESGRFIMEIASYGHVDGWSITPLALPVASGRPPGDEWAGGLRLDLVQHGPRLVPLAVAGN
jgi:hypothetical protein